MRTNRKLSLAICFVLVAIMAIVPMFTFAASAADTTVTFELGANGSASHYDGSEIKKQLDYTVDGYTLSITGYSKAYSGARDAKGNSCIKLGTSSAIGSIQFAVPDDVTSVVIHAAKYKAKTSKLSVNGTTHTLSVSCDNGEYAAITVDTTSTKTIEVKTVSGAARAMINTIEFIIPGNDAGGDAPACDHNYTVTGTTPATCTVPGLKTETCSKCQDVKTSEIPALGHDYEETNVVESTCTEPGSKTETCTECGDVKTTSTPKAPHNYVDGVCTECGEVEPDYKTIIFDDKGKRTEYSTTKQVWEENGITVTNTGSSVGDYANPARFYKSSVITIDGEKKITKIEFACNTAAYATSLATSIGTSALVNDKTVTVTFETPVEDFTVTLSDAQVRLDSLTVYYVSNECQHTNTKYDIVDATCTKNGEKTLVCEDCGEAVGETETLTAPGHNHVNGACTRCNHLVNIAGVRYIAVKLADDANFRYACSTLNNNRFSIFKSANDTLPTSAAYAFAIVENDDGTYSIKSMAIFGEKCYVGINSDNQVVYTDAANAAKVNITDNNDGIYVVTEVTTGRNLGFNNQGSDYCSWYKTSAETNINLIAADAESLALPKIANATVTVGTNLAMNFIVDLPDGFVIDGMKMVFTMNGVTVEVKENDTNVFTYTRLAPQCMGDTIKAELVAKDGAVLDTNEYSVKQYADYLLSAYASNPKVVALVIDMLNYGAAAQEYLGYKTDALVNADLNGAASDATPVEDDVVTTLTQPTDANYGFYAVGVRFDYVNKIFVRFKAPSLENVTILANGVELATPTATGDGIYIAYSAAISALDFGEKVTFQLQVNGETVQTLTYSVNTYAFNKYEGESEMAKLALALYRYGKSAVAYKGN